MYAGRTLSPDEFWARIREQDDMLRSSFAGRPTFGLEGWRGTRTLAEWSLGGSTLRSLRYDDGPEVTVLVATADGPERNPVDHLVMNLPRTGELSLGSPSPEPDHRQPTEADDIIITLAGVPTKFAGWKSGDFIVVGTAIERWELAVCSRGVDPAGLRIDLVSDIEPYIEGRREVISAARRKHGFDE